MRLFVAIDIDDAVRQRITRYIEGVCGFAPEARWVRPESLHVTLKFIGEKPPERMQEIEDALASIRKNAVELLFRGHGFFPTPKAPRVFWIGIECGPELPALANAVDEAMSALDIPKETHPYSPHLTLARGRGGSGAPRWRKGDRTNKDFQHLMEKLSALPVPEFGAMTARKFFLYESQLLRGGARYTKMAEFPLQ